MLPSYYRRSFYETAAMPRHQESHPTRVSEVPHLWERLRHDNAGLLGALDG
jgi:hypothetical protein